VAAVDLEPVRGGPQGDPAADHPALPVAFDAGQRRQHRPDLVDRAAGGGGEVFGGDRFALGQQVQQRLPGPAAGVGGVGFGERLGQPRRDRLGGGVHGGGRSLVWWRWPGAGGGG
jgi:hypothetical protein